MAARHNNDHQKIRTDLLRLIKWKDKYGKMEKLKLYTVMSAVWEEVSDLLMFDPHMRKSIEDKNLRDSEKCIRDVIEKWMQDEKSSPNYKCTWTGLCELLEDLELTTAASDLRKALSADVSSFNNNLTENVAALSEVSVIEKKKTSSSSRKIIKPFSSTELCTGAALKSKARDLKFPGLDLEQLTEEAREDLISTLNEESSSLAMKFMKIPLDFYAYLKEQSLDSMPTMQALLNQCSIFIPLYGERKPFTSEINIQYISDLISRYCSFFNYDLLQTIFSEIKYQEGLVALQKYENDLEEYAKRRICHFPSGVGMLSGYVAVVVKLDDMYEGCDISHLLHFHKKLCDILKVSLGQFTLDGVKPGCVCVIFHLMENLLNVVFPLSDEVKDRLKETKCHSAGITQLSCETFVYKFEHEKSIERVEQFQIEEKEQPALLQSQQQLQKHQKNQKSKKREHQWQEKEKVDEQQALGAKKKRKKLQGATSPSPVELHRNLPSVSDWRSSIELDMESLHELDRLPPSVYIQSVVIDGTVYIGGGYASKWSHGKIVMAYSTRSCQWHTLPPYHTGLFALTTINNKLVLVGGYKSSMLGEWQHDSKQWSYPFPPMSIPRMVPSTTSHKHWLVAAGGCHDYHGCDTIEILDVASMQWSTGPSIPIPWLKVRSTTTIGDTWYLIGGIRDNSIYSVSLEALISHNLQESSKIWKKLPSLNCRQPCPLNIGGSLFAVGGQDMMSNKPMSTIQKYFPDTKTWSNIGELPYPLHLCTCIMTSNQNILIVGPDSRYIQSMDYNNMAGISASGSFKTVQFCTDPITKQRFARKHSSEDNPKEIDSMHTAVNVLSRLGEHDHIIQMYGAVLQGAHSHRFHLPLDMDRYENLFDLQLDEHYLPAPLKVDQSLYYFRQLLTGVKFLHDNSMLHLDIKSHNLLFCNRRKTLKLCNNGTAMKIDSVTSSLSKAHSYISCMFAAPEICRKELPRFSSDIWSCMCVFVEMVTALKPWHNKMECYDTQISLINAVGSYRDELMETDLIPHVETLSPELVDFMRLAFRSDHTQRSTVVELLSHPLIVNVPIRKYSPDCISKLESSTRTKSTSHTHDLDKDSERSTSSTGDSATF